MGQCFGTDCAGLCPRWSYRQEKGFDRYTKFAPKNRSSKYGDEHLLNEIQDPRSDDDLDFSDISSELTSRQNHKFKDSPVTSERKNPEKQQVQPNQPEYTTITIEA
ncbi:uncharacterized protein LOC110246764 [Exaiptasia diaphana]|uniref:Uncharacterized protein n=1 Tax=Exaiptasia diaphana TaxID=2652724 RepID=A0A913XS07_EXADI|nr:uncharacterized protein LOC110246764 [Exaiptasia diaphana]